MLHSSLLKRRKENVALKIMRKSIRSNGIPTAIALKTTFRFLFFFRLDVKMPA